MKTRGKQLQPLVSTTGQPEHEHVCTGRLQCNHQTGLGNRQRPQLQKIICHPECLQTLQLAIAYLKDMSQMSDWQRSCVPLLSISQVFVTLHRLPAVRNVLHILWIMSGVYCQYVISFPFTVLLSEHLEDTVISFSASSAQYLTRK